MSLPQRPPMTLEQTDVEVRGHQYVEGALFTLCGAWSTDPATASGPAGAEIQAFFAEQSALHGWRGGEWEKRRPRSVGSSGDGEVPGWPAALAVARSQDGGPGRLACWAVALQPSLAARYRSHALGLAPAADQGLDRWLGIALDDVLRSVAAGSELLTRAVEGPEAASTVRAGAGALAAILGA